jgi:antitoxin component YwqK of YwqJK toxin-antitoxin module
MKREVFLIILLGIFTACTAPVKPKEVLLHQVGERIPAKFTGVWKVINGRGQLVSEENYLKGKHHGLTTQWYKSGRKMREFFSFNDELNGIYTEWRDNGFRLREICYHKGLRHGINTEYNARGMAVRRACFLNGLAHGLSQEWYADGQRLRETYYIYGKREGPCTQWDLHGNVLKKQWFKQDQESVFPQAKPAPVAVATPVRKSPRIPYRKQK